MKEDDLGRADETGRADEPTTQPTSRADEGPITEAEPQEEPSREPNR